MYAHLSSTPATPARTSIPATRILGLFGAAALAAAACSGGGGSVATTTPTSAATQVAVATLVAASAPQATTPPATSEATQTADGGGQATPHPIDPCTLLTQDEASTAVGAKLGAGVSTLVDKNRVCTWKNGLTEVKLILAPEAPDAATAQAYWDAERPQVPAEIKINDINMFDRAAYGSGAYQGYSVSALFVIKGTTFFDFYCGLSACSENASATAAQLIGDRLP